MGGMQREQQQALAAARQRFADGGALAGALLAPPLQRSWERSRLAGVQPRQEPHYAPLARHAGRLDAPADRRLARCVREELDRLWAAFGGRQWTLFCVNAEGRVIAQREHGLADVPVLRPIQVGRQLRECDIGTTAPSCSLAEDAPALVRGNEHYLDRFAAVFCLSVPLHGLDGEVLGALDITGTGERDAELLHGYFRQAALSAENRLMQAQRACHLLAVQHDARWLHSPLQGLLAVQEDGRIRAANRVARRLFGLPRRGPLPLLTLEGLFAGASVHQRRRLLQPGAPYRVRLDEDTAVHVQYLRAPLAARASLRVEADIHPAGDRTLRAHSIQAMREAVATHHGNVSAAARQLGVSRTTLYKHLRP
ncbi:helix-turn-helix domain-containing protein [Stenotrophomonas sp.]|uniref:helix-turn-helix domain-containing protein n=1 Tax=Stenotrophomonas TaxID=40323 RepID=UPI0028A192C7|nr:helix-turn-helix domain-containing protein [Stenotrophomonas sp.]